MDTYMSVKILEELQKTDREFLDEKEQEFGASTFCPDCGRNVAVGRYPFWYRFARSLCSECGKKYHGLLKEIGAYDSFEGG